MEGKNYFLNEINYRIGIAISNVKNKSASYCNHVLLWGKNQQNHIEYKNPYLPSLQFKIQSLCIRSKCIVSLFIDTEF